MLIRPSADVLLFFNFFQSEFQSESRHIRILQEYLVGIPVRVGLADSFFYVLTKTVEFSCSSDETFYRIIHVALEKIAKRKLCYLAQKFPLNRFTFMQKPD